MFEHSLQQHDSTALCSEIMAITPQRVERALAKEGRRTLDDFAALISPAAEAYLEPMAQLAQRLTRQRFGSTVSFYIPLYLSNLCANSCSYCGFSMENRIKRRTLDLTEIETELVAIKAKGYDSILLVTGEHARHVGVDYFLRVIPLVRRYFSYIAIEVQPLSRDEYQQLKSIGVNAVYVYQETYQRDTYLQHHKRGKKRDYSFRLATAERLCEAGMDKVGLGVLLGLDDWRADSYKLAMHLSYLERRYWKTRFSVSFPRLRPCVGSVEVNSPVTDKQLIQLICAYRIFNQEVDLSLSTRESALFRDNVVPIAITHISAESKTQPGGYSDDRGDLEQFSIDDSRSTEEVALAMQARGLQPVFKDWEGCFAS
jgi:2-iminoacetate synthase